MPHKDNPFEHLLSSSPVARTLFEQIMGSVPQTEKLQFVSFDGIPEKHLDHCVGVFNEDAAILFVEVPSHYLLGLQDRVDTYVRRVVQEYERHMNLLQQGEYQPGCLSVHVLLVRTHPVVFHGGDKFHAYECPYSPTTTITTTIMTWDNAYGALLDHIWCMARFHGAVLDGYTSREELLEHCRPEEYTTAYDFLKNSSEEMLSKMTREEMRYQQGFAEGVESIVGEAITSLGKVGITSANDIANILGIDDVQFVERLIQQNPSSVGSRDPSVGSPNGLENLSF